MKENVFTNKILSSIITSKDHLIQVLKIAVHGGVLNSDSASMMESIININNIKARDIMIPRQQMSVIDINDDINTICNKVIHTGHSRFPVINGDISKIIGILHGKDLIEHLINQDDKLDVVEHLRDVYFVPEIKHLDSIMYEMRIKQTHMAIVVDEFTNIVGMITLEMIVEEIVGNIEDEHDYNFEEKDIVEIAINTYRLKGQCRLEKINKTFESNLYDEYVETIGGYIIRKLGRVPKIGEVVEFGSLKFEVSNSDSRKIKLLNIQV